MSSASCMACMPLSSALLAATLSCETTCQNLFKPADAGSASSIHAGRHFDRFYAERLRQAGTVGAVSAWTGPSQQLSTPFAATRRLSQWWIRSQPHDVPDSNHVGAVATPALWTEEYLALQGWPHLGCARTAHSRKHAVRQLAKCAGIAAADVRPNQAASAIPRFLQPSCTTPKSLRLQSNRKPRSLWLLRRHPAPVHRQRRCRLPLRLHTDELWKHH